MEAGASSANSERTSPARWTGPRLSVPVPAIAALALLLSFAALQPVGYHGGGRDDWHYFEAARCAAENGLCVPTSHWWTRWPLVAPLGATLWLFGEGRQILWIVPAAYAAASTILFALLVERQFGRVAALVASLALVATPVFNARILSLNVDIPELTWVLAALFALQSALRESRRGWAAIAGILMALAIVTRPTSVSLIPIAGLGLALAPQSRKLIVPFVAAICAALAVEAVGYGLWAGDPLLGWRLALSHTTIPSTELPATVDLSQSPLFNIAYIDGWIPASGIELHWTVDPILNLLAHPSIGVTLLLALVLLILAHRFLANDSRRICFALCGAAALHFGALAYALAIDPKPRMFLFEAAVAAAVVGVCGTALWRRGFTLLLPIGLGLLVAKSVVANHDAPVLPELELVAANWIAQEARPVATNEFTRRALALVPAARGMPVYHGASPAPAAALLLAPEGCSAAHEELGSGPWRLARQFVLAPADKTPVAWLRRHRILFGQREAPALCVFRRT